MNKEENPQKSKKKDSKIVKKIKQKMYAWHRTIGIITVIPVIFWTLSGLMHPVMAHWFKPTIKNIKVVESPINKSQVTLSLQEVLQKNSITLFKNFRILPFNNKTYYQIKTEKENELLYFDAQTAEELKNGDQLYAEYLSRFFLDDFTSKIVDQTKLTNFDSQYKYVNRYVPVWKIKFDRADHMDVYVETTSSKLATYNPRSRQIFIWIFDAFHNWSFIEAISNNSLRIIIMMVLLIVIVFSSLSGIIIYGFFWNVFKKTPTTDKQSKLKKHHRKIGLATAFVTLTFAISGAYHATTKWDPNVLPQMIYSPNFKTSDLGISNIEIGLNDSYKDMSIIQYNNNYYYQLFNATTENTDPITTYINTKTGNEVKGIEMKYAEFLAQKFANINSDENIPDSECCEKGNSENCLKSAKLEKREYLTEFNSREYGFVNKRLPVIQLQYDTPENTTFYIEPSTSRLAALIENSDRYEGYSFAFLHKFLFMDWAGKNVRDFVMAFSALGVLVVSLLGFILFLKK